MGRDLERRIHVHDLAPSRRSGPDVKDGPNPFDDTPNFHVKFEQPMRGVLVNKDMLLKTMNWWYDRNPPSPAWTQIKVNGGPLFHDMLRLINQLERDADVALNVLMGENGWPLRIAREDQSSGTVNGTL